jgi:hypothetical protein
MQEFNYRREMEMGEWQHFVFILECYSNGMCKLELRII